MNFSRPAVFVHSTATRESDADKIEWQHTPIPYFGSVWNEHQKRNILCSALGVDDQNRVWVGDTDNEDGPIIWYKVTGLRHE